MSINTKNTEPNTKTSFYGIHTVLNFKYNPLHSVWKNKILMKR